jgi:anthranilate phosphoribosyltransferase
VREFIKAVGGGPKVSRDLSREEARTAMGLLADGDCAPEQVGAFLMALRYKGESADELAGFTEALMARCTRTPVAGALDVDCHGDGHAGRPSLLPAAACAAAALGVTVVLRADLQSSTEKHGLSASIAALGLGEGVRVLDLVSYAPALKRLVDLRPLFGRRTVAQTLCKLLDPTGASARIVGVFHAPYLRSIALALGALGAGRALCVQAIGGLPEGTPGKMVRVASAEAPEPRTLDLRALPAPPLEEGADPVRQNVAALDGADPALSYAAAAAALLLHAARGDDPLAAAAEARDALASGAARRYAPRL